MAKEVDMPVVEVITEHQSGAVIGTHQLGVVVKDIKTLLEQIEKGFPFSTFIRLQRVMDVTDRELAHFITVSYRTLTRRKAKGKLTSDESERLLRASRLFKKAVGLFEDDINGARNWLHSPNRALGGKTPLEFGRTELGGREVENLIDRLEHGDGCGRKRSH